MNYKCSFPVEWLGLENEELAAVTGLKSAGFCHKGGFLMTTGELADAVQGMPYQHGTVSGKTGDRKLGRNRRSR